jgi:hypothetical protein
LINWTAAAGDNFFTLLLAFKFFEPASWCPKMIYIGISLHHQAHLRIVLIDMQEVVPGLEILKWK